MKSVKYGEHVELVCSREEFELLKAVLEAVGVVLSWSMSDGKTYECYVLNPYKQAIDGWGNEGAKQIARELFDRYKK